MRVVSWKHLRLKPSLDLHLTYSNQEWNKNINFEYLSIKSFIVGESVSFSNNYMHIVIHLYSFFIK